MRTTLFKSSDWEWIDIVEPTKDELIAAEKEFCGTHAFVRDALNPKHLPKLESDANSLYLIVRHYDSEARRTADSTHSLTRKVAVVLSHRVLLSVHRKPQPWMVAIAARLKPGATQIAVLREMLLMAVDSFEAPSEQLEKQLEELEHRIFGKVSQMVEARDIHFVARKLSVIKRNLFHMGTLFHRLGQSENIADVLDRSAVLDLKERAEQLIFFCDELLEEAQHLIQLQLSLASQRTNEVMRVLTIFSVFFMPLTFIVGVYGMNFKFMPELGYRWSYPIVWIVMLAVTAVTGLWFKRRGFFS